MRRLLVAAVFVAIYLWNASTLHYHYSVNPERQGGRNLRTNNTINRESHVDHDRFLGSKLFVVDEAILDLMKYDRPAIMNQQLESHLRDFTADVVSIGSNTRLNYLQAQVETWSSHINIRNFWGFTELQDYDVNCTSMTTEKIAAHLRMCKSPHGWDAEIEKLATNRYGETDSGLRHEGGWICAQRRVGRALGWLHNQYQNNDMLPDVLILVDDDTSLDMSNLKKMIIQEVGSLDREDGPLVYAGCYHPKSPNLDSATKGFPFHTPHGGFGTYFNKYAIQILVQPVFCDIVGDASKINSICINLKQNRIGELQVFREGISIMELFYRYSAIHRFCMHSDWLVGYMIHFYLYPQANSITGQPEIKNEIVRVNPPLCGNVTDRLVTIHCTTEYTTCHRQTPKNMESLAISAFVRSPGDFNKIPHLDITEFIMDNPVPKFDRE